MLSFTPAQMALLRESRTDAFLVEMVTHCTDKFPRIVAPLAPGVLDEVVRGRVLRAMASGLSLRGSIRLFLELSFVLGAEFDTDPQFPWAGTILALPPDVDERRRARKLFDATRAYLREVHGPGGAYAVEALVRLEGVASSGFGPSGFAAGREGRLWLVEIVFPRKAKWTDVSALNALFDRAEAECTAVGFARERDVLLVTALMLAFGHGCFRDDAQPWIAGSVADVGATPEARADRLERRAMAWLRTVNAARTEP